MSKLSITQYSHHFSVKASTPEMRRIVHICHRWMDEYEDVEVGGEWDKRFKQSFSYPQAFIEEVDYKDPNLEYRFHINALPHFKQLLVREHVQDEDIKHVIEPIYEPVQVKFHIKPHFKPFPEQVPMIPQICTESPLSKMLPLQTGGGKSYLTLVAMEHWGYRACGFMKPGYLDKWETDIHKTLEIPDDKIMQISGGDQLKDLMRGIEAGYHNPDIILVSNATFRNWISDQEKMPPGELVQGYPCFPWEFFQYCGIGFRFIDEVHQDYHANFRFDLVTHVEQSLSLSATLVTKSDYLKKMYKLGYPESCYIEVPEYRKYTRGMSWHFDFMYPERIKTMARGRTSYSHVEFEKSILRSSKLTREYYLMIYEVMRKTWLARRREGYRCLVYFATRQMCEDAVFLFRQLLPGFKINKFNQGDPMKNITESDLCFATIGKAGAAIDIANLTVVIRTVAIDSIQAVLQTAGRLRDIRRLYDIDDDPLYVWFVCDNFDKHKKYHRSTLEVLDDKLISINKLQHNVSLGSR